MYEDNEEAKALSEKPPNSHYSKYIDVGFHFLHRVVILEKVVVHTVASTEQNGDALFRRHRDFLMNLY